MPVVGSSLNVQSFVMLELYNWFVIYNVCAVKVCLSQ